MYGEFNRRRFVTTTVAAGIGLAIGAASKQGNFRAGAARKNITPTESVWMSGYAARKKPSESVFRDLWAKALVLEDTQGERVVIVAADLIKLPREVCDEAASRLKKKNGLQRKQLFFNASHNHCGPVVLTHLSEESDVDDPDELRLIEYRKRLIDALVEVVGAALADLGPATVETGRGSASFAANRRNLSGKGGNPEVDPDGPVDHDVPVLKISTSDGKPKVVLFGYACHNTTLTGFCYQINGDFAGFAQAEMEKALPGTTAMFLQLCGGDQNPKPRGNMKLAMKHGKSLAEAVQRVLSGGMRPVSSTIRTAYEDIKLDFARQDRSVYEQEAKGENAVGRRRAKKVLAAMDAGRDVWRLSVPVQAVGLGDKLALLGAGGELVVDYSLRLKREFPQTELIVAGCTNDVICYIPSLRVLREGGYEAVSSMMYYGWPGPFAENVEEKMIGVYRRLLKRIGG